VSEEKKSLHFICDKTTDEAKPGINLPPGSFVSYGRIRIKVSKSKIMFARLVTILRVVFETESESVRFFTYVRT